MTAEELYYMLQKEPFQPVRVHLVDGRSYDIPLRRMAIVGMTYLDIGIQAPGYREGIIATMVTVPLEEIKRIEPLPAPAPISE